MTTRTSSPHSALPAGAVTTTIVAWDRSAPSRAALAWALGRTSTNAVHLLHVLDRTQASAEYFIADATVTQAKNDFLEEADRVRRQNPALRITAEFVLGDPITVLRALSTPETLIVVGTHARDGATARYEWSVGARLAGSSPGPVAIIPETSSEGGAGIVVGVDGSAASTAALVFAAHEASRTGEPLRAIHAWQEPLVWRDTAAPDPTFLKALEQVHRETLTTAISSVSKDFPGLVITPELVRGAPQWTLLDAARNAALVVVGNHGLYGIRRQLLGVVSHSIVLNIQSPTVVVNSDSDS
ncbi:MAG: universal stress protein [Cryobacterium sp.]